jgi:hypothetical protein
MPIYGKGEKTQNQKSLLNAPALNGWVCEDHPNQPWSSRLRSLLESCAEIQAATKIRIPFIYPSIVVSSQAEEHRQ